MNKEQTKTRIEKLRKVINYHRYLYHVLDREEISDAALDSLKNELAQLEKEFPEYITPDSPTQRVGGEALSKFQKVEHRVPMLSIDDVFSVQEIEEWEEYLARLAPHEKITYFCELKIDGFAVSLLYKNGVFAQGSTRGNGYIGEDVTANIKTIESIPLRLDVHASALASKITKKLASVLASGQIEIRGEVYMGKKAFLEVNKKQRDMGEKEYANPRNLAAGSVRQLDPRLTASRNLAFFAYDIIADIGQTTHEEEHEAARALGFRTEPHTEICKNKEEIFEFYKDIEKKREKLPYQIDGIVVSVNDNALFEKLGVAGKSPRGIRAFKFAAKQATTILLDIEVHVGRQGAVTPIAHVKPVEIAGVTISRATLHNEDEIRRLGVKIGDTVIVERAGDVIPAIVQVVKELRPSFAKEFRMPSHCPVCKSKLAKTEEVILRCVNSKCPARSREYLYFFVSRKAFNIEGLGPKIIDKLVDAGLVSRAADIFDLKDGDLLTLEHCKETLARKIVRAIEASKTIPLGRFVYSLGIRYLGEERALDIAEHFLSVENFLKADLDELKKVPDIGDIVAKEIHEWVKKNENQSYVRELLSKGIGIVAPAKRKGRKFEGLTFVFTGTLQVMTREAAEREARMQGGEAAGAVSRETSYVVIGENPGSKYEKAKKFGVKIISEEEFLKMLA